MPPRPQLKPLGHVFNPIPIPIPIPLHKRSPPLRIGSVTSPQAHQIYISPYISSFENKCSNRAFSSSSSPRTTLPTPPTRWYSDLKARLGKCIMFGCSREQAQRAAGVIRSFTTEWRILTAGAEGFLTGGRRGLENQQVVWGEMDSFGHVNNANYIRYAESARVNWIIHFASVDPRNGARWRELMTPTGTGLIMKSIKAEYKFPMTYPDTISAYHKLRFEPSSSDTSLVLDCIILSHSHKRVAARTEEDVVVYDYRAARKTPVPPFALDMFRDIWRLQEEEVCRARARIWGLVGEVEKLEKETWDRAGAVEDLGAAGSKS
ncbi:thioesterase-like superfamily-domain-containing protein [Jackrogersella minutella]|nr:thioesterase-like superfamily-domain-containing protein [Jackrogersella minutella]